MIRVHHIHLVQSWSSQNFYDFHKLVHCALPRKQRFSSHHLSYDAPHAPYIYCVCVPLGSENEFWRSIISRADIAYVWVDLGQLFRAAKVTYFQDHGVIVDKQILGLYVSVADIYA